MRIFLFINEYLFFFFLLSAVDSAQGVSVFLRVFLLLFIFDPEITSSFLCIIYSNISLPLCFKIRMEEFTEKVGVFHMTLDSLKQSELIRG